MAEAVRAADATPARRPIRSRDRRWARGLAGLLARAGVRPNQVSLASVAFAAVGAACYALLPGASERGRVALLLSAAAAIQLRLLCNLMDGMLAVEGGMRTSAGELFNDVPDRAADLLLLVSAGYGITWFQGGAELGWLAGTFAVLTAYVRTLGGSLRSAPDFTGPMAKQHRMAVLTAATLLSTAEAGAASGGRVLAAALVIIAIGCAITAGRRLRTIARDLEAR